MKGLLGRAERRVRLTESSRTGSGSGSAWAQGPGERESRFSRRLGSDKPVVLELRVLFPRMVAIVYVGCLYLTVAIDKDGDEGKEGGAAQEV